MIPLYEVSRIGKFIKTETRIVLLGSRRHREQGVILSGSIGSFSGDENVLELS